MAKQLVRFVIDWQSCLRCGACIAVCPQPDDFTTPLDTIAVDAPCAIACLRCERICPVSAITQRPDDRSIPQ